MPYATTAEIQSDFKDTTFDDAESTNVKTADVTQFIVEADALINSYIGTVYVTPVAAGEGLQTLKLLCRSLVAARIKRIMEVKQEVNTDPNQNIVGVLLSPSMVMKILENIQAKKNTLIGATLLVSGGGFFSKNVQCDVEPVVKKDTKQW